MALYNLSSIVSKTGEISALPEVAQEEFCLMILFMAGVHRDFNEVSFCLHLQIFVSGVNFRKFHISISFSVNGLLHAK